MFPKIMVPQIIHLNGAFHYKPSIWGTTIFANTHILSDYAQDVGPSYLNFMGSATHQTSSKANACQQKSSIWSTGNPTLLQNMVLDGTCIYTSVAGGNGYTAGYIPYLRGHLHTLPMGPVSSIRTESAIRFGSQKSSFQSLWVERKNPPW